MDLCSYVFKVLKAVVIFKSEVMRKACLQAHAETPFGRDEGISLLLSLRIYIFQCVSIIINQTQEKFKEIAQKLK